MTNFFCTFYEFHSLFLTIRKKVQELAKLAQSYKKDRGPEENNLRRPARGIKFYVRASPAFGWLRQP